MELNEQQKKAYDGIWKFLDSDHEKMMIMGPSGSGKTTLLTKAVVEYCDKNNIPSKNAYFIAFTNKAVSVLKKMVEKSFPLKKMTFKTIHNTLQLTPNYSGSINQRIFNHQDILMGIPENSAGESTGSLLFDYDYLKTNKLKNAFVLIVDECSTISRDLFIYLESTCRYLYTIGEPIKVIFLGDYYQLPPVNEKNSIVFKIAVLEKWPLYKLKQVMRSNTSVTEIVNTMHLKFIEKRIKNRNLAVKHMISPYNILPQNIGIYESNYGHFLKKYIALRSDDKIIITYTKTNCNKINMAVQKMIDDVADIERDLSCEYLQLIVGDRVMLRSPIFVSKFENKDGVYNLKTSIKEKIFSGDIFIVTEIISAQFNTILGIMDGYLIKLLCENNSYLVAHIDKKIADKKIFNLRRVMSRSEYFEMIQSYKSSIPQLIRGHCITCYKSQGSEYENVFVNLKSFWYSLINDEKKRKAPRQLFSAFYTATTRSSNNITLYY